MKYEINKSINQSNRPFMYTGQEMSLSPVSIIRIQIFTLNIKPVFENICKNTPWKVSSSLTIFVMLWIGENDYLVLILPCRRQDKFELHLDTLKIRWDT